jgi:hypothetical protein
MLPCLLKTRLADAPQFATQTLNQSKDIIATNFSREFPVEPGLVEMLGHLSGELVSKEEK